LWINHINDETKMAEELNNLLPVKKYTAKKIQQQSITTTTDITQSIGSHITNLQNTIKDIPGKLLATQTEQKTVQKDEITASSLALKSQSPYALPAITRELATPLAKASAGKTDPLSPIEGFRPFPKSAGHSLAQAPPGQSHSGKAGEIPPPPPGSIPPPPPPILSGPGESLPISELPSPPERPSIARYLKVIGILGDRAFMSVTDQTVRRANHLPKVLAVSAGDRVDFLSIIDVTDSTVTVEENGERLVKHLSALR